MKLSIHSALPDPSIAHFVHSFWFVQNQTGEDIPSTVLPNGMIDLMLTKVDTDDWKVERRGLDTTTTEIVIKADTQMFSIGFKLLAVEYVFSNPVKNLLNKAEPANQNIWQFDAADLLDLAHFRNRATEIIKTLSTDNIDNRKLKLFDLLYASGGAISVKELSEKVYWSSRQINRYFNQQYGLSLKAYCKILRFGASFKTLSEGKLVTDQNFTDQNHFIKEIKKYAGVTPKELSKNTGGRFVDILSIKHLPS